MIKGKKTETFKECLYGKGNQKLIHQINTIYFGEVHVGTQFNPITKSFNYCFWKKKKKKSFNYYSGIDLMQL